MKADSTFRIRRRLLLLAAFAGALSTAAAEGADAIQIIGAADPPALAVPAVAGPEIWKDPSQPLEARVRDLVARLSPAEKISQLSADAPAIPRLGIPAYSYRNECLHGVAFAGVATVFPEPIGMAATWDPPLIHREADIIATEARAKFNDYTSKHDGNCTTHHGISFYAPNINLVRDPRWGRGQETYGEDPFLTARLAVAFIRGLQGDNPTYVKALAGVKHFAVYSGPEPLRHRFDATPSQDDLYDTYLPAFEAAVNEGQAGSVMGAYPALYGVPDCANPFLLTQLLRQRWGFKGFVVSDGGAIQDIWDQHKFTPTPEAAAASAVNAGCDLFSGGRILVNGSKERNFEVLGRVLREGLLSEKAIDAAVSRTLAARFRLGLFDPPARVPWSGITLTRNDTAEHRALALKVAQESIVLLKNDGLLPLNRAKIKRIAVIGANADSKLALLGNYAGTPSRAVTILEGIKAMAGTNVEVMYQKGCPLALKNDASNKPTAAMTADALAAAKSADVVIYVGGLDSSLEMEEGRVNYQGFLMGDRTRIELPTVQEQLLRALRATGRPVIFVNCSGSAIAMPWEARHLQAIVQAWYPGEEGGSAVAQTLFGEVDPSGRLPITFYGSTADLPSFDNYSMSNRTYRYFTGKPLFAFGHGLSYARFRYRSVRLNSDRFTAESTLRLAFTVENASQRAGDEVAQVYFRAIDSTTHQPRLALCAFKRIHLASGQVGRPTLDIPALALRQWDTSRQGYVVKPGKYELLVGAASDDIRLRARFEVTR